MSVYSSHVISLTSSDHFRQVSHQEAPLPSESPQKILSLSAVVSVPFLVLQTPVMKLMPHSFIPSLSLETNNFPTISKLEIRSPEILIWQVSPLFCFRGSTTIF